jgi:dihydrofolate synthase/folylpolyglutamate synthase
MQPLVDFADTIRYLERLADRPIVSWKIAGLQRMTALFDALGNPQEHLAAIQVAGTSGKGSTTTMAAAILRAAGYATGAFTSPHLQSYRERIALDGTPVDERTWLAAMREVQPVVERLARNALPGYTLGRPAFLEVLWAMAALIFVERPVQCAVLETGVGGRMDPVTVNAAPVAVITNVSLDHTDRLGSTVDAIAAEKAGLIKTGQIVISAAQGSALAVIRDVCRRRNATLWCVREPDDDVAALEGEHTVLLAPDGTAPHPSLTITTPLGSYRGVHLRLQGRHQWRNAACAVAAVDALAGKKTLAVGSQAIVEGLAAATIPGRMELIEGHPPIVLDGAKGPAAAEALAEALDTLYAGRRVVLLLGMLNHKDIAAMAATLCARATAVVVAEPPWSSHAAPAGAVAEHARRYCSQVEQVPDVPDALRRAQALAAPEDLLVVAGPLILVGAVRDLLVPPATPGR